ncbi:MAG: glycosyltransferase [Chitinophagaceae bacterium]|nr:glycosyltransferase [Chitinophagaceae bacterium]
MPPPSKKLIIIGPAHPLRGGLASFNERLARQFMQQGFDVTIYTFSLQYPGFLFPGKTQYSSEPAPQDLDIKVCINSVNPLNWLSVGNELKALSPDVIVVRYWLPFMAPALGTILSRVRKNNFTKIVCIADNVIPHERHKGDNTLTRYFFKPVHAFITMSQKVMKDLVQFTSKPAEVAIHPLYDNFGERVSKEEARAKISLPADEKIILFFGFIRHYKGLDLLLRAMADERMRNSGIKLLVAGEFYENRQQYDDLIKELRLGDQLILRTDFIADSEVKYYLSAADFVIQPYRDATQSGVTPLAYHFEKPMLVTNVGGLPDMVPHDRAGIVTEADPASIAQGILDLYEKGPEYFITGLQSEKVKYSWEVLANKILRLASLPSQ